MASIQGYLESITEALDRLLVHYGEREGLDEEIRRDTHLAQADRLLWELVEAHEKQPHYDPVQV